MARTARLLPAFAFLFVPLAGTLFADTVTLRNGRELREVVTTETSTAVRIEMPGGELTLPRSQVLRVERGPAPLREYEARRDALRRVKGATAAEWLELAQWVKGQGLDGAAREAALQAAVLEPDLAGLAPILTALGYVRDEAGAAWIDRDDLMRSKGFVQSGGAWLSPAEQARREEIAQRVALARESALVAARQVAQASAEAVAPCDGCLPGQPILAAAYGIWGSGIALPFLQARVARHPVARPVQTPSPTPVQRPLPAPESNTSRFLRQPTSR